MNIGYISADFDVLVVSHELKEFAVSCGVAGEQIDVLPNAVDPVRFSDKIAGDAIRILRMHTCGACKS